MVKYYGMQNVFTMQSLVQNLTRKKEISKLINILKRVDENIFAFSKWDVGTRIKIHRRSHPLQRFEMEINTSVPSELSDYCNKYNDKKS